MITDPIADMFTKIRNAVMRFHEVVDLPSSNFKLEIAKLLKKEGYILDYKKLETKKQPVLRLFLKYGPNRERVINEIKRISKPGRRIYRKWEEIPLIYRGLGLVIVSTSEGVMSGFEARKRRLGGEIIGSVF